MQLTGSTLPRIAKALERIAIALEEQNSNQKDCSDLSQQPKAKALGL